MALRRMIAIAVLGVAIAAWLVLLPARPAPDRGKVRVTGREAPLRPATPRAAPSAMPVIAARPEVLRALRLPLTTPVTGITRDDPREGIVCGSVLVRSGSRTRFVYLGSAAMAALDDGDVGFEALHRRVCGS